LVCQTRWAIILNSCERLCCGFVDVPLKAHRFLPQIECLDLRSAPEIDHKLRKRLCCRIHIPNITIGETEINVMSEHGGLDVEDGGC